MDLQLLRAFVVVARTGSIACARRELFRSQPAVSGQLKALEDALGVSLFARTARGMVLTAAGTALLPRAQAVLDADQALRGAAARLGGGEVGPLRVGTSANPAHLRLPALLERVAAHHPELAVEVHHGTSGAVLGDVRAGRLELALVIGPLATAGLAERTLQTVTVLIAAPAGWRADLEVHGWTRLAAGPWVVGAQDTFCGRAARARAAPGARVVEVDHPGAVLELVAAGVCAGVLHEEDAVVAERDGAVVLWRERPLRTELRAVWDPSRAGEPGLRAVLPILGEVWEGAPTARSRRDQGRRKPRSASRRG